MTPYDPKQQIDSEEMADLTDRAGPVYALIAVAGLLTLAFVIWSIA